MSEHVTCKELVDFLDDYLEDRLEPPVRRRFEEHLDACPPCRVYLDGYRDTVRLTRSLCDDTDAGPPAAMPETLIRAILDSRRRS
ncbi:MAG: zf-HC2 domain-containing protein [Phycisphaerales bacterium]|nr:zf-HC2 domain-containing protein [Phycisphaerales bacterium]NNM26361.1 zf-HC2 domain-containing protein [Phycisphaerales bacterium]